MTSKSFKSEVAQSVCRLCRQYTKEDHAILTASRKGHVGCLLYALDIGADVNCGPYVLASAVPHEDAEPLWLTPLTVAVANGNDECVDILLKAGADVNNTIPYINSPLMIAVEKANPKCFKILLEAGADINMKNRDLDTALTLAVKKRRFNFVKPLLEAGADVKYQGWNMFWHLAEKEEMTILKTLLQVGSSVNLSETVIARSLFSATVAMTIKQDGQNVLTKYLAKFGKTAKQEVAMLLYAAGEKIRKDQVEVPDYLQQEPSLKHLCREAIREHLLQMSDVNLFVRVPKLGLPKPLQRYVLYHVELYGDKGAATYVVLDENNTEEP